MVEPVPMPNTVSLLRSGLISSKAALAEFFFFISLAISNNVILMNYLITESINPFRNPEGLCRNKYTDAFHLILSKSSNK